ncbi:uncharacterized protein LOC133712750 [Rosa rugosa]|uniref:uncharacterized protein LOC133712750 n=1 Tax=Rosa rugosa TaxID=74645 RepID=UPI002B40E62F|nr:uncharacterized protein LOC133712750 [Rosa rugosa]
MSALRERSLHIADLQAWMDKAYFVNDCFPELKGEIVSAKLIVQKSGYCYGFLEFRSHKVAKLVLETYNGKQMPKACQHFRLNWSRSTRALQTTDASQGGNYKLVVAGDLPKDVTAEELQQHFRTYYPSVKDAEVHTSESQGLYGVITFAKEHERHLALIHMDMQCFRRKEDGKPHHFFYKDTAAEYQRAAYPSTHPEDAHPNGSTIYIQNLEKDVTEGFLLRKFSPYGEVSKVTIRGCALIQFVDRSSGDIALLHMNDDLIQQNSLLTLTMRKLNDESVPVASSVEDFKELTELKELTHEDERSVSGFKECEVDSSSLEMADRRSPSLHIADLQAWMDKPYLRDECFPKFPGEVMSASIFVEKCGYRYGFLEFRSPEVAELVRKTYNGKRMPKACQYFRLNRNRSKRPPGTMAAPEEGNYKLVVDGDLPKDVTAEELQQHFRTYYPSVKDAEVHTSESQGLYGVITFAKEHERDLASIHMASQCFRRTEDGKPHHFFYKDTAAEYQRAAYPSTHPEDAHPNGSKIYIQNLEMDVTKGFLLRKFSPYGEVSKITIRGCALIQFVDRSSADKALLHMNDDLILQNSLLPLTVRKSNDESVPVASSVEDLKELTHEDERSVSGFRACEEESTDEKITEEREQENDESVPVASAVEDLEELTHGESPKDLKELTHDDEGSVSGFRTCEEESTDEITDEGRQENDESVPVASAVEDLEELTHGESPKDLKELTHDDEGSVSGFRTCEEESTDEITDEGRQENDESVPVASSVEDLEEQKHGESPKDRKELTHEDEGLVSGFRTCEEEPTDEKITEEGKQEEEVKKVRRAKTEVSEGQRRRRKAKKARQKEKKKLLKQTDERLEASEGQQTNEGFEAPEGQQTNEGSQASEGHQLVISWLWELYASLKHYLFGC